MSDSLKTQIRDYFVYVHERQRAATALQERLGGEERPGRSAQTPVPETGEPWPEFEDVVDDSRPGLWDVLTRPRVFTAVLAVVAVPVAVALVLIVSSSDTDSSPRAGGGSEPAASPGSAGDAPVATPAPTVSSLSWSRVPHHEAVFGGVSDQTMWSVTVGGPGLVAVGSDGLDHMPTSQGKEGADAAVWTSVDGLSWSRVPDDPSVFGGLGNQIMKSVIAGGPGLVAVGSDRPGSWSSVAAAWTSVDGVSWSRVPHDEAVFGGDGIQLMVSVIAGGPGLVAVGMAGAPLNFEAAVWTSVDGIDWSRVAHGEAVFGGEGWQQMASVTAGGPGLVAVGSDGSNHEAPTGRGSAVVWTSVDGLSWSRVPHDETVFGGEGDQSMTGVAVGGPGLVAVGHDGTGDAATAAVWTSVDGLGWTRVPDDEAVFDAEGAQWVGSVAVGGPGLVAVVEGSAEGVWASVDGLTWSRIPHDEAVVGDASVCSPNAVIAVGPSLVAVGEEGEFELSGPGDTDADAAVWVAATED